MRIRILVIDDEESYCEILKYNLEKEGYEVDTADSAETALGYDLSIYQLMIVDIMMERLSGFDFAKRVRNNPSTENVPLIFCSALNGEDETVMGLNIGADDYITKPFTIGEVIARVRAVLRRTHAQQHVTFNMPKTHYEPDITYRTMRIDRNEKTCYINGREIPLSRKEFDLLLFFLVHRERIHSRDEIMNQVWGNVEVTYRAVDTNIARLRKKIAPYGDNIVTRLGFGYGFKSDVE
ncbi:MAG: response regulator transcription factor [Muribaculaceae bacterium]|jgi:two-component system phosphate regulon response regulator PhoB|nr:response regulator transcription factor [Muribaculaceae bacterium]